MLFGLFKYNKKTSVCANGKNDDTTHNTPQNTQPAIFKMITKEGQAHYFTYLEHTRYSPNRSSACGYGSDDWFYLCQENNTYYLLMFSDTASYGTAWMCTELLEDDYEKLLNKDVDFWNSIVYSKEQNKTYGMHLTDVNSVRHLLPTMSRCGKLTDEHF